MRITELIRQWMGAFYNKCFKVHCPNCGGIMDSVFLDIKINKMVYECRDCGERFV